MLPRCRTWEAMGNALPTARAYPYFPPFCLFSLKIPPLPFSSLTYGSFDKTLGKDFLSTIFSLTFVFSVSVFLLSNMEDLTHELWLAWRKIHQCSPATESFQTHLKYNIEEKYYLPFKKKHLWLLSCICSSYQSD